MSRFCLLALAVVLVLASADGLDAQERFPRPEFESGYKLPETTTPAPRSLARESVDLGLLALALAAAAYLAIHRRSRRGLLLLSIACLVYFGFVRTGCVCPVGSVQNVAAALAQPELALPAVVVALFVLPLAVALFYGRVFCAGVCPFGALQDLVMLRTVAVPRWLNEVLGLGRHIYLGAAVLLAATGATFLVCRYDPFVAVFRLSGSFGMLLYGAAFIALSTLIARPYCRFLCPYSVLLGWMAALAPRRIHTSPEACLGCRLCEEACPSGAIRPPTPERPPEDLRLGVRRLVLLLVLLPVMASAAGWATSRLDGALARVHPDVRLAERLSLEEAGEVSGTTLESRTFRATGAPVSEAVEKAHAIRASFRLGGWLLGIYLGLVFGLKLISLSLHRARREHEPDPALCFSCGRCFDYCPQHLAGQREVIEVET
jgi:ferredoxin